LLFAVVGVGFVAVMFYVLGLLFSAGFEAQTGLIERWIVRATCDDYELGGSVRDSTGAPVAFATIEAAVAGERFTTRSGPDGRFSLTGEIRDCDIERSVVAITVRADDYRQAQTLERFDRPTLDVVLQRASF
jgi:hypothetical protein